MVATSISEKNVERFLEAMRKCSDYMTASGECLCIVTKLEWPSGNKTYNCAPVVEWFRSRDDVSSSESRDAEAH